MRFSFNRKTFIEASAYVAVAVASLAIVAWVLQLWRADLAVPFNYSGDANMIGMNIKSIIDTGWYLQNGYLGAPFGFQMFDYPDVSNLDCLLIKLLSLVTHNYGTTLNVYFLLTFPMTAVAAMLALRQLKISLPTAMVVSVLYSFLPYHFLHGEAHLFLASYFMIPLMAMVIIWLLQDETILFSPDGGLRPNWSNPRFIACAVICLLTSMTEGYYVVFSIFFVIVAGVYMASMKKKLYPALTALAALAILLVGFVINNSPTIVYQLINGNNPLVDKRAWSESETFGLKIIQLLMPIEGHRIPLLASISAYYNSHAPLVNENAWVSLGIVGSVGFLTLVALLFIRNLEPADEPGRSGMRALYGLSVLTTAAIFLASIGGFAAITILAMRQIRCYNRIAIFLAFFSLFAVAVLIELFRRRYARGGVGKVLLCLFLLLVLVGGVLDQTSAQYVPPYNALNAAFYNDQRFVDKIEATVPANSMVFVLPYIQFPEANNVSMMQEADEFRGYLHSTNITWSAGTMTGRAGDQWMRAITAKPTDEMVRDLAIVGFDGIWLDSYGYDDHGVNMTANLTRILGVQPIVSDDNRLYFFDMSGYDASLKANLTEAQLDSMRSTLLQDGNASV